jgi:hypothetical protein
VRRTGTDPRELWEATQESIINRGMPLIALVPSSVRPPGPRVETTHYLVIYGFSRNGTRYAVYDPWDGRRHTLAARDWGAGGQNIGHPGAEVLMPAGMGH